MNSIDKFTIHCTFSCKSLVSVAMNTRRERPPILKPPVAYKFRKMFETNKKPDEVIDLTPASAAPVSTDVVDAAQACSSGQTESASVDNRNELVIKNVAYTSGSDTELVKYGSSCVWSSISSLHTNFGFSFSVPLALHVRTTLNMDVDVPSAIGLLRNASSVTSQAKMSSW